MQSRCRLLLLPLLLLRRPESLTFPLDVEEFERLVQFVRRDEHASLSVPPHASRICIAGRGGLGLAASDTGRNAQLERGRRR